MSSGNYNTLYVGKRCNEFR